MTKTTLSDGRRTRPRFAAPTPTPPKFLIGTIEQSENHSTPSKQTTNPNPNGHKSRFSRPPWPIAASPCRTHLPRPPWRIALSSWRIAASGFKWHRRPAAGGTWKRRLCALAKPRIPRIAHTGSKWHRHSCLCAVAAPGIPRIAITVASLPFEILIANLELEFGLTHTKLSPLRISNRKYFAVFHSDLLHRREKSGRPTTSDGVVVATGIRLGFSSGFSRAFGHRLQVAPCGRPPLCGVAEERQESDRNQRDCTRLGRADRVRADCCENGVVGTIGQSPFEAVCEEVCAI